MDDVEKVHVVVGASGGTGTALVRELVARGRRVRAVNRSGRLTAPAGVEVVAGDATDPVRMAEVCRDAGIVYNAVNVAFTQWRALFPAAVDGVLAGARAADARLVFVDDTWMYGRVSGPMTEDLPYRPVSNKPAAQRRCDRVPEHLRLRPGHPVRAGGRADPALVPQRPPAVTARRRLLSRWPPRRTSGPTGPTHPVAVPRRRIAAADHQ